MLRRYQVGPTVMSFIVGRATSEQERRNWVLASCFFSTVYLMFFTHVAKSSLCCQSIPVDYDLSISCDFPAPVHSRTVYQNRVDHKVRVSELLPFYTSVPQRELVSTVRPTTIKTTHPQIIIITS